jgi:MFS family permease
MDAKPLGEALDEAPMSPRHRRFWLLAGLGIMLDGFDFFIIGVANPLIAQDFGTGDAVKGLISAAAIVGAIFGAALLGPIADRVGRRRIFRIDLWLFVVFSLLCVLAWDAASLIAFRFMLGLAIGLDYPIAASYLAEVLPSKDRGRWLVSAFSLQAVGILLGALVGVVVLNLLPEVDSWRLMLGLGTVPALIIIWLRRGVPESPRWLAQNGHEAEAAAVTEKLVGRPVVVTAADRHRAEPPPEGIKAFIQPRLFRRDMIRRTIFTAVPWFLMDIATYGVGIFTPTILAALALAGSDATFLANDIASTEGTALLDVFLVLGFLGAIFFVERAGRVRLQLIGFAMMAVALGVLALAEGLDGGGSAHIGIVIAGFALFNTFMNLGPNATTYALPAEVFPSEIRAAGHGFAAGCAKLGAALGVFLFPILLTDIGTSALLLIIAGGCALAFVVTAVFAIEPRGRSLNEVSGAEIAEVAPRPAPP